MRTPKIAFVFTAAMLLATVAFAAAAKPAPVLLTADQKQVETLAKSLLNEPAIKAARAAAIKQYEAAPAWQLDDGKKTLQGIIDETLYGVLLSVASDPADPKIVWTEVLPYTYRKQRLTGSRYAGDSPDRAYRGITIDPTYRYEIRGKLNAKPPLYISIESLPRPAFWGLPPLASIFSKDIDFAADGTFKIEVDSTPTDGRRNHLQMPPGSAMLLLRDTIPDWGNQLPNTLSIKRVDDAAAKPRSRDDMIRQAVALMDEAVTASLKYFDGIWARKTNQLDVFVRPLGWGVLAVNRFSLQDDEALVITLDPQSAQYLSLQVMDPWLRAPLYAKRTISLNDRLAKANADGSFTYVLSPKDPGVYNWLDTGDLHDGIMVVRWELLSKPAVPSEAVREVRKIALTEVASSVPAEVTRVTPAQRRQQLAERQAAYETRVR